MHCTLLVPDLLPSLPGIDASGRDLPLPALSLLLARGRRRAFAAISVEAWLCQAFEVERQHDWPVAPLTLAIDGIDAGDAYWLRADPVHLAPRRGELVLMHDPAGAPTAGEAAALVAALNAHFAPDGIWFSAPHPERWYLRLEHAPALATQMLPETVGRNIDACLPTGEDGLMWHRRLNEIQMLLHAHPVNEAREAHGQPPINSVWLWGGGTRPSVPGRHFSRVWSDDALASALATAADTPAFPLPGTAAAVLSAREADRQLVVLPQLRHALASAGFGLWREQLLNLERDWFAPLLAALRHGTPAELAVITPDTNACLRSDIARRDLWKFWRMQRPLFRHG